MIAGASGGVGSANRAIGFGNTGGNFCPDPTLAATRWLIPFDDAPRCGCGAEDPRALQATCWFWRSSHEARRRTRVPLPRRRRRRLRRRRPARRALSRDEVIKLAIENHLAPIDSTPRSAPAERGGAPSFDPVYVGFSHS
jgi:hypothetical protein